MKGKEMMNYGLLKTLDRGGSARLLVGLCLAMIWSASMNAESPTVGYSQGRLKQAPAPVVRAAKKLTLHLPGKVPLTLVRIKAGSFQMGSPAEEGSRLDSRHRVVISDEFFLGRVEVTQGQWRAVMGSNPAHDYGVGDECPVYNVSWNDIAGPDGFLDKLNQYLESTEQGVTVSLPSEAQWEYACRAGTTTRWYFGDSLGEDDSEGDPLAGAMPGNRSDYMWFNANSNMPSGSSATSSGNPAGKIDPSRPQGPHPVGLKRPNAWGLYDMSGNVAEWCHDWFHDSYAEAPTDGAAWLNPAGRERVTRGGSWSSKYVFYTRSAHRFSAAPDGRFPYLGFRLAAVVGESE
jgi:formylglycine-generating enzyme required for sulfatase activity